MNSEYPVKNHHHHRMNINQHTDLFAVVGFPLKHTMSPVMHNAAFGATGLNAVYLAFETRNLEGFMAGVRAMGIRGLSVTLPHKIDIIPFLDDIHPQAKDIGAVNTIVHDKGRLIGHNTDASGALSALQEVTDLSQKTCLIVGAGGAARAIGFALKDFKCDLFVTNRTPDRGMALAHDLQCAFVSGKQANDIGAHLLIQTTPVGMYPNEKACPLPAEVFKPGMVVMDAIYNPPGTRFLNLAKAKGCKTVSGLRMFLHQGAEQFRLWTGLNAPMDTMKGGDFIFRQTVTQ